MSEPGGESMRWSELVQRLRNSPEQLRMLLAGASYQDLHCSPGDGGWSVCEVVAHLCAVESPYRARLVRIVLEDQPCVAAIHVETGGYDTATPLGIMVDTFSALRAGTSAFLENLPPAARGRMAQHAELGCVTLREQVEALLAHDREHLARIAALLPK
jgi:hypothetical protein